MRLDGLAGRQAWTRSATRSDPTGHARWTSAGNDRPRAGANTDDVRCPGPRLQEIVTSGHHRERRRPPGRARHEDDRVRMTLEWPNGRARSDHRRCGAVGPLGCDRRKAARSELPGSRAGHTRQLDPSVSAPDGVFHDRNCWKWAVSPSCPLEKPTPDRSAALLPARGRHLRSADRARGDSPVDPGGRGPGDRRGRCWQPGVRD